MASAAPDQTFETIAAIIAETASVDRAKITPEAHVINDLGIDSLAAIEWGMTIEDAFGISLPEDAWQHVTTYGDVEELVLRLGRPGA